MTDEKPPLSPELEALNAQIEMERELQRRKKELEEKNLYVKEYKIGNEFETIVRNRDEIERAPTVRFGSLSDEALAQMIKENEDYIAAARNPLPFINEDFKGIVPFFRNNLILIGSKTGGGKSTVVSNVIYKLLRTRNKATGKGHRVLLLSNEEKNADTYNRVACLLRGWSYTNHSDFTDDQVKEFKDFMAAIGRSGKFTVIEDTYEGISGWTTTPEGIELIFDNLIKNEEWYDAVIIDYYQNISSSKTDPSMVPWQVQEKFNNMIDKMKLKYPAPILLLAQMDALKDEDDTTPYKLRINGRKSVADKSTFIGELEPQPKTLRSKWMVWKSRWTTAVGKDFYSGYDRGMLVPYSMEFPKNVAKLVAQNIEKDKESELGIQAHEEDGQDN